MLLGVDYETFWSNEYTLSKMATRAYIMDPRFEIIGVALKCDHRPALWMTDLDEMILFFSGLDPANTVVYGHNLWFDGGILSWRFGFDPALWLDTLAMARSRVKPFTGSASLASTTTYLGLGAPKGNMAVQAKGLRKAQMPAGFLAEYGRYARHDIDLSYEAAKRLRPEFSNDELHLIDRSVRMYVQPRLRLNAIKLGAYLKKVQDEKAALLDTVDVDRKILMSNPRFAEALRERGVEPPTKISKTTGEETYAFAKTDLAFKELLDHPDLDVQTLVAARLGTKSTIEETRTTRLLDIAIEFETLAVPLYYAGAHTGRFSGAEKLNLQNLTRGSAIRDAIEAPPGHSLVVADASQIEARLLAWFCKQLNIVDAFARGIDVYALAAQGIYRIPHVTKASHPRERQVGKVATLQLGYGSGSQTFWLMCRGKENIDLDIDEAEKITKSWRRNNQQIVNGWYKLFGTVENIFMHRRDYAEDYGPVSIGYWEANEAGFIRLPGGYTIWYPDPKMAEGVDGRSGFGYWKATKGGGYHKLLWHGEIMNNVIQGLARVITMKHGLQISTYPVAPWAMQCHDELMFVVKNRHAEAVAEACRLVMSTPPDWARGVPLAVEVHIGKTYGEAK